MKSQSNQYPVATQYDKDYIAVPMNITTFTKESPVDESIETGYQYDLIMVLSTDITSQTAYVNSVQALLDTTAQVRGYDNIISACTFTTSNSEIFAGEGQACVSWRDAVWLRCYEILAEVQSGVRQPPTIVELLAEMPTLVW